MAFEARVLACLLFVDVLLEPVESTVPPFCKGLDAALDSFLEKVLSVKDIQRGGKILGGKKSSLHLPILTSI